MILSGAAAKKQKKLHSSKCDYISLDNIFTDFSMNRLEF